MRARHCWQLVGLLSFTACTQAGTTPIREEGIVFRTDTSMHAYIGDPVSDMDSAFASTYYESLPDVDEPPLRGATVPSGQRVLRFTWVRSFHPMIVIRLMQSATACRMLVTLARPRMMDLSGIPLLVPGDTAEPPPAGPTPVVRAAVSRRDSSLVATSVCDTLAARLDGIGLTPEPVLHHGGVDGSTWLLERVDARGHALAMYWSPDMEEERSVREVGLAFLRAANVLPSVDYEIY